MTTNTEQQARPLPLAETHGAASARMMTLAGWSVPAYFADPEKEYFAAAENVALLDVSFLTIVSARGKDIPDYLNRRLSQRVIEMKPGEGLRANQLNADGRMEADLEIFRADDDLHLLIAPPAITGEYLQALCDKFVFSEDAQFGDETGKWAAFALLGPKAGEVVSGAVAVSSTERIQKVAIGGAEGYLITSAFFAGAHVVIVPVANAQAVYAQLEVAVRAVGGLPIGFVPFDTIRVENGIAWYGIDLTEKSIPLEADLNSAIHTNKGCYPGQETIAKILNLGHPARKLVGVVWETGDPPATQTVLEIDSKEIGRITSSTYSPGLKAAIGLAMVRWQHRAPGTKIVATSGITGITTSLPFPLTR
ncbi:glycine cleavage T C-terminal barrel domain-containing protein [soil metagenome]